MDEIRWERVAALFDQLLAGAEPAAVLSAEPDPEIRQAAEHLWRHHMDAAEEDFLGGSLGFEVRPTFQPGQLLLNRFRIERMLGSGGMGEVYLAFDKRMEERIALKTVARLLAPSPSIRRRIVAEVQNARRVTHPNVCRIHELFEEGETVFFSMEYVEGTLLSDLQNRLAGGAQARPVVRQMAEGLHAAHRMGVVHGDFKPANVMVVEGREPRPVIMDFGLAMALNRGGSSLERGLSLRAGTVDYMAPELLDGSPPTIRSDIFAFGKVGAALLPNERIWDRCTRPRPEERIETLDPVIQWLDPHPTRRYWIGGTTLICAASLAYSLRPNKGVGNWLPEGARLLVNGIDSAANQIQGARLARAMLLTALRQSPRIRAIADQDLLPELRRLQPGATLPLADQLLQELAAHLRAAFWIDGDIQHAGGRYSLRTRLLRASDRQVVAETSFRDLPAIAAVAQQAALWVRTAAGESQQSLAANPVSVTSYTSEVPEALEKYYDAMEHYAIAEMKLAIPLLREAVRLDPAFAQAHNMLGMTTNSEGRFDEALREVELAMRLSGHLPERERGWIEANYYTLTEDPVKMVEAARQNTVYYPDEARFYRILAYTLTRSGDPVEAVKMNRKAVELAPDDQMQRTGLIYHLCEAGENQEALSEFAAVAAKGIRNDAVYGCGGLAYACLGRYQEALEAYQKQPDDPWRAFTVQGIKILQGDLEGPIAALRELRAGAPNAVIAHQVNEYLCGLYYLTDRPDLARSHLLEMVDLPKYPPLARLLDCTAFWAGRLGDDLTLSSVHHSLAEIAANWRNSYTTGIAQHAEGLQLWRQGNLDQAEDVLSGSAGRAFSIWTRLDLADFYAARSKPQPAEQCWQAVEDRRGVILEHWFTGALILAWFNRAVAADARGDRATARKYSQKVLDHWSRSNPGLRVVQTARTIHEKTN